MKHLPALFLLLFISASLRSQVVQTRAAEGIQEGKVAQEIRTMEQQLSHLYPQLDATAAERLYAADYRHTFGVPARTITRAEVMESYLNPAIRGLWVESMTYDVESIQSYGNTAVAKGTFVRKGKDKQGRNADLEGLFTHVWVKGVNGWQLVSSHHSPKQNPTANTTAEQEIAAYFNRMTEAQRTGDTKQIITIIDSFYADNFKGLGASGVLTPKDSIRARNARRLAEAGNMQPFFETNRREDLNVEVYGDAAVATSRIITRSLEQAKAGATLAENRSMAFLVRQNGQWKVVGSSVIPIRDAAKDSTQILEIEKERLELDLRGDKRGIVDYMNQHLSDNLVATEGSRVYNSKADFLKEYNNKKENRPEAMRNDDLQIRVYDNTAIVTGTTVFRARGQAKANKASRQQQFTRMYVKQNGIWKVMADHRSPFSEIHQKQTAATR